MLVVTYATVEPDGGRLLSAKAAGGPANYRTSRGKSGSSGRPAPSAGHHRAGYN